MYDPRTDWDFRQVKLDLDQWRDTPVRHRYIHGEIQNLRFSFYFPPKEEYRRRFFHFLAPAQGSENASQIAHGEDDKLRFALTHGGYFVESNMGGGDAAGEEILRCNAAAAVYSRILAETIYGPHRPYGYVYGGSGGSLKTCAAFENTQGIWDGAVPFVIGSPMAIPNNFTVRAHALRILRHKLPQIIDGAEPGGGVDQDLNPEERAALQEATDMGFPTRAWFSHDFIGDGALPLLTPLVTQSDPDYLRDFWEKPGYLGADPAGSACRDRIRFPTRIRSLEIPPTVAPEAFTRTGVDDAWHVFDGLDHFTTPPKIHLEAVPQGEDRYLQGTVLRVLDGEAAGACLPLGSLEETVMTLGAYFQPGLETLLRGLKPGDAVLLDNSDYLALQTYHRHQLPPTDFAGWRQFRDSEGNPRYPQRETLTGPAIVYHGSGAVLNGKFTGKMIVLSSLLDESAFPYIGDWYRSQVQSHLGAETDRQFRLWFTDHAMHAETQGIQAKLHVVGYLGVLHQALLDLAAWVEEGIPPPKTTGYTMDNAQVRLAADPRERGGVQPVISLLGNGQSQTVRIGTGSPVTLIGEIRLPTDTGEILSARWDLSGTGDFETPGPLDFRAGSPQAAVTTVTKRYTEPGVYFPVLRVTANRNPGDSFTVVSNLARIRVTVSDPETVPEMPNQTPQGTSR